MTISLNPETEALIQQKLSSGAYASADALITAALEAMDTRLADIEERKAWIDSQLQVGLDELDAGQFVDGPAFFASLETKYQ